MVSDPDAEYDKVITLMFQNWQLWWLHGEVPTLKCVDQPFPEIKDFERSSLRVYDAKPQEYAKDIDLWLCSLIGSVLTHVLATLSYKQIR